VAQQQVEQWEKEEGMETTLIKKNNNSIQNSVGNEENAYPVLISTIK
jgi:carbamoylphosphate synthase large subunit